jgi:hypothetical protein
MIGSETFIIVALRWTENSTPCSRASATCSARKASSARRRMTAASMISPASSGVDAFRTLTSPSAPTSSIRTSSASPTVTDRSVERKSPPSMVATCDRESADHAPMRGGCLRAKAFTAAGARRSELPSRSTGLTALPLTVPYRAWISRSSSVVGSSG